jgi:Carboxypeptidase regulatory-like domain
MSFLWNRNGFMNRVAVLFCALALLTVFSTRAIAQAVAVVEVAGHVTDPTGQAIVGAQVKITEVDKHQVHTAVTDNTGRYALQELPPGAYRLEVSAPGFKGYSQTGIVLQVGSNPEVPVRMTIGAVTESVEVVSNAGMVETKESAIGQAVDTERMLDLPSNGRNPAQLLQITGAGVSNLQQNGMTLNGGDLTGSKNIQGSNTSAQFSVAGGQANGVNFLLDGGDNNDAFSNVNLPIPFPDAVQEFNVQTSALPAQYGLHPGGVVNIVTKSGANAFHGDLFDFFRHGHLNARQKGDAYGTQPIRDSLKRNQFGGTMGGRIIRDKLFFFGGYQGTRQRSDPAQNTAYTPTAAALAGDFSVLDGAKSAGGCLTTAKTLKSPGGSPYPNNFIPPTTFDQAGQKLSTSFIPLSTDPCGKTLFGYLTNNPDDQWIGRVDYVISSKQTFFGRYYLYDYTALSVFDGKNALTTGTPGNFDRSETMTIGDTYSFSPTLVNAFHATFDRRRDNRGDATNLFSPKDLGSNMYVGIPNYTQLTVSGYSGGGFNVGCGTCAPGTFDINTYQVADDFTIIHGKHQIAFGFDGRKDQFNSINNQQANGQFTFNGTTSGDGLADLLLGRFSGLTDGNVISDYLRQTVIAAYVQDAFHATSRFTVNFGVRWEPSVPAYDKYGRGNQFSWPLFQQNWHSAEYPTAPAGLIFSKDSAQDPYGKAFTASHWATFSPRLGMVWDPQGDGKSTLRASAAIMHDTTELFYPERWTTNAPYVSSVTLTSGQFANPFASYTLNGVTGDPFPGNVLFPTQGAYISVPPNLKVTYMMQFNVSYQREVAKDWLVTANYLGSLTRHIWGSTDVNYAVFTGSTATSTTSNTNQRRLTYLANPTTGQFYGDIQQSDDGANAEYNGLLVSLNKRFSHNFTILTNYTLSHCVSSWDFAGELAGVIYQNPLNRKTGERGNCGWDHRHVFNLSVVAVSGGLGEGALKMISKGWTIAPLVSAYTGSPIQLSDGGKDISLSGQLLDRPNVILPDQVYPAEKTLGEWFNPLAFAVQAPGTFGNLGRNSVYGPGAINFDMAVSRQFRFKEHYRTDIRADFFNILNHANWNNPTTSNTSSTFGQVTAFGSPRIIQLALKFLF